MFLRFGSIVLLFIYLSLEIIGINLNGLHYLRNFAVFLVVFAFIQPIIMKKVYLNQATKLNLNDFVKGNELNTDREVILWKITKKNISSFAFSSKGAYHILINEKYFSALKTEELRFVIFHELKHVCKYDVEKNIMSWAIVIALIPFLLLNVDILYSMPLVISTPLLVIVYLSLVTLHFYISRNREIKADIFAAQKTSFKLAYITLDKISDITDLEARRLSLYHTHPSINKRKSYLIK